ncbi:HECT-domain-containing protein [Pleurostoma richardsiae]|uniref:HECT-type E3 ubiquitin transferase n=1 Tax=Pleurostoma richardsiae TaxID=41990 RepID=A0AA38RWP1_9PEZI|nr:HECT-domain-containing protein [Pleurostoma richardsiae]
MAPWPPQQGEYARRPRNLPPPPAAQYNSRHIRNPSRIDDLGLLDSSHIHSQIQAESSDSDSDFEPSHPRRPNHGRSMSHPFPSLFSTKKKRQNNAGTGGSDSDSASGGGQMIRPKGKTQVNGSRHGAATGSKDFVTGNCMTCGSLVRWPRELKVFKCTICLTINDLEPISDLARAAPDSRPARGAERQPPVPSAPVNASPISLEHTNSLIRQCLHSFIRAALADPPPTTRNPVARHSRTTSAASVIGLSDLDDWYSSVISAGQSWVSVYETITESQSMKVLSDAKLRQVESDILQAQEHTQRILLKASELLLKRPGRPLSESEDLRFLLIILANPLLHAFCKPYSGHFEHIQATGDPTEGQETSRGSGPVSGKHSVVIKRILGLLSHAQNDCHSQLIAWFARYPASKFLQVKDLVGGFLAYRLIRQNEKKHEVKVDFTDGLIPNMSAGRSPASLHAAIGPSPGSAKKQKEQPQRILYNEDWQIKAAARVMALLFAANNAENSRRSISGAIGAQDDGSGYGAKDRLRTKGQIVPTSDFYTTLLDDSDLVADFEAWESKRGKFSFCQYPFLLSIWAKIQILEYDARRQMRNKARDAFFDSILTHRSVNQLLILNVRRDCLVEDSLKAVSEVIGSGGEDIKKGLKIVFKGEEGVDAGGLRKEWFLLLVREVFNPDHGMFVYDEDSQYCYFNPHAFETSDQFFLVGVVFGLAIYNSTILDVAFPPFAFRKLLAAAPAATGALSAQPRSSMTYTLDDLAEYRPRLAKGLRQLLEYDGDVESTFCLDFVVDIDKYGSQDQIPLCPGGERRPVTNENRKEYVDLYVRYLLDSAVSRQFEPFKRGFFTVCGGNALSLFRPEEIELLVRGSEEPLDIDSLRLAANYDNWGGESGRAKNPAESETTIQWFWQTFEQASPQDQRKLLLFITGSDRIPAMGAASLSIRISCLGDDCGRYPTARTCFNTLTLWRYTSRERLETMLWRAVRESEGFGLK